MLQIFMNLGHFIFTLGRDGTPEWVNVEPALNLLQNPLGCFHRLSSRLFWTPGVRAGFLPRSGAGEEEVWKSGVEHSLRLQRE